MKKISLFKFYLKLNEINFLSYFDVLLEEIGGKKLL